MDELQSLVSKCTEGLRALQGMQRAYDNDMWDIGDPAFENLRHIHLHLSITVGKVARLIEPRDHRYHHGEQVSTDDLGAEIGPIVADFLMHAAQLATLAEVDLADALKNRYAQNAARFAPESQLAKLGE